MTFPPKPRQDMEEGFPASCNPTVVVAPPFVSDTELGVTAVDVSVSGCLPSPSSGLVALCFGGHPAAECLLDATGSGMDHEIVVAIDKTRACHRRFAIRLHGMIKPEEPVHVIPLPQEAMGISPSPGEDGHNV